MPSRTSYSLCPPPTASDSLRRLPGNPVLGGVLGYIGIFAPGIMLKFAMLPTYSKFREHPTVRSTLRGLNSAASGLVWTAVFRSSPSFSSLVQN